MTKGSKPRYAPEHLAILVPTKDRPAKIRALLGSLAAQEVRVGRVIVVDGGESVASVVAEFRPRLPVEHHVCRPPGQIRQRNVAIGLLDHRTPLAASLDDDIVLETGAVQAMIDFWNEIEAETAAVSFNIVNTPPEPDTWLRRVFGMAGGGPGRVLRSGMPTSNCQVAASVRVEWVCGGATVWRTEILQAHPHRPLPSKWAIAEDIVYSYPIGQRYPLYVAVEARVRHEHVFDYRVSQPHRFHGYTQTLWLFHFVGGNPRTLSKAALVWMVCGSSLGRIATGIVRRDARLYNFAVGQLLAVGRMAGAVLTGRTAEDVIVADAVDERRSFGP